VDADPPLWETLWRERQKKRGLVASVTELGHSFRDGIAVPDRAITGYSLVSVPTGHSLQDLVDLDLEERGFTPPSFVLCPGGRICFLQDITSICRLQCT